MIVISTRPKRRPSSQPAFPRAPRCMPRRTAASRCSRRSSAPPARCKRLWFRGALLQQRVERDDEHAAADAMATIRTAASVEIVHERARVSPGRAAVRRRDARLTSQRDPQTRTRAQARCDEPHPSGSRGLVVGDQQRGGTQAKQHQGAVWCRCPEHAGDRQQAEAAVLFLKHQADSDAPNILTSSADGKLTPGSCGQDED